MSEEPESARRSRTSRPTTPLRPSSRSSFRESAARAGADGHHEFPLNAFEPAFAELSDAMADLEANMMHFQLMHESLSRFSESFASFLYGLNMNAFCVDFPEAPIPESFKRAQTADHTTSFIPQPERFSEPDAETTFMTTDTTFVDNPSASAIRQPARSSEPSSSRGTRAPAPGRGGYGTERGRGRGSSSSSSSWGARRGRQSGLAQPRVRGLR